nr:MAG TPA: hypothetical protein [Caudoviricetes sp.]
MVDDYLYYTTKMSRRNIFLRFLQLFLQLYHKNINF